MLARGIIVRNNEVLMVQQKVQRGEIVWIFPGGEIEKGETPEEACIREVKEETGLDVKIGSLIHTMGDKYTFLVEEIGGNVNLDKTAKYNDDIIDVKWISLDDIEKFDVMTEPIRRLILA